MATDIARDAFDQDLLYSFGAFLTFGRVKRENAEPRILSAIKGQPKPEISVGDQEDEEAVTVAPDIEALGREQVRQHITQSFAGHDLADLIGRVLAARGYSSVSVSPPGADRGVDILPDPVRSASDIPDWRYR
jgi:restriction system protein